MKFAEALENVARVLARTSDERKWLEAVLADEPKPGPPIPVVEADSVDLPALAEALEWLWAAYRDLPEPPGVNSLKKYSTLPAPLPRRHRGVFDQCYRVWTARGDRIEPALRRRLASAIVGDVTLLPGMEGLLERYPASPPPAPPRSPAAPNAQPDDDLTWHDPGPGNPFGVRLLDVRPLTQSLVATTADPQVAARFGQLRASDGRELVSASISQGTWIPASLRFPHNGAPLEGDVFKASCMEEKWDIHIYDSTFLFARSWTGDLVYRACAHIGTTDIRIREIECPRVNAAAAPSDVYFLIASHAMQRVLPHRLPADTPRDPQTMAIRSFSLFGRFACYATFDDITTIPLDGQGDR